MRKRCKTKRAGVRLRNPLAPVVRALRPRVKPSAKAYSRKLKHKWPPEGDGGSTSR